MTSFTMAKKENECNYCHEPLVNPVTPGVCEDRFCMVCLRILAELEVESLSNPNASDQERAWFKRATKSCPGCMKYCLHNHVTLTCTVCHAPFLYKESIPSERIVIGSVLLLALIATAYAAVTIVWIVQWTANVSIFFGIIGSGMFYCTTYLIYRELCYYRFCCGARRILVTSFMIAGIVSGIIDISWNLYISV